MTRNHKSVNLGIRVPVPGNHLFVLDYSFYFCGNSCQGLAASAVRSSLYKYPCRNYDSSVCTKVNLKSDFHIAGQLMETHPEYSTILADFHIVFLNFKISAVPRSYSWNAHKRKIGNGTNSIKFSIASVVNKPFLSYSPIHLIYYITDQTISHDLILFEAISWQHRKIIQIFF